MKMKNLFPSNNLKHVLIVGEPGVGKSTLIRKVINALTEEYGLKTLGLESAKTDSLSDSINGTPVYLHEYGVPRIHAKENLAAYVSCTGKRAFPEVFNHFAGNFGKYEKADLIILDELGFLESEAQAFCDGVLKLLDGETEVIAAVKPKNTRFLQAVRNHENSKIFMITEENRDALFYEVLTYFRTGLT